MTFVLRRLFGIVLIAGVLAPATAALCLPAASPACAQATAHDCCEGPRLSSCECQMSQGGAVPAEAAQRNVTPASALVCAGTTPLPGIVVPGDRACSFLESSPPSLSSGDRLTLFSILLV